MRTATCPACGAFVSWPETTCPHCGKTIKAFRNLVGCRVCGNPVAKNANKCPNCGIYTPNKSKLTAMLLLLAFVSIWLILMVIDVSNDSDTAKQAASKQPSTTQAVELTDEEKAAALLNQASAEFQNGDYMDAIELCSQITSEYPNTEPSANMTAYLNEQYAQYTHSLATDLMDEYDSNIVNADQKYTDTVMVITGTVSSIGKTNNDKTLSVLLESNVLFACVQLNFTLDQTDAVAALREGDTITAIGLCTGISGTKLVVLSGNNVMVKNCYIID